MKIWIVIFFSFSFLSCLKVEDEDNVKTDATATNVILRMEFTKTAGTSGNSYCIMKFGTSEENKYLPFVRYEILSVNTEFEIKIIPDSETFNMLLEVSPDLDNSVYKVPLPDVTKWTYSVAKELKVSTKTTIKGKVISTSPYIKFY